MGRGVRKTVVGGVRPPRSRFRCRCCLLFVVRVFRPGPDDPNRASGEGRDGSDPPFLTAGAVRRRRGCGSPGVSHRVRRPRRRWGGSLPSSCILAGRLPGPRAGRTTSRASCRCLYRGVGDDCRLSHPVSQKGRQTVGVGSPRQRRILVETGESSLQRKVSVEDFRHESIESRVVEGFPPSLIDEVAEPLRLVKSPGRHQRVNSPQPGPDAAAAGQTDRHSNRNGSHSPHLGSPSRAPHAERTPAIRKSCSGPAHVPGASGNWEIGPESLPS